MQLAAAYGGVPTLIPLWYKITDEGDGTDIPASDAKYVVTSISDTETELTIRNVASEDDIIYVCEATQQNLVASQLIYKKIAKLAKCTQIIMAIFVFMHYTHI